MSGMKIIGKVRFAIHPPRLRVEGRTDVENRLVSRKELERLGTAAIVGAMKSSAGGLVCAAGFHANDGAVVTVVVPHFWGETNLKFLGHELAKNVYAELGVDELAERECLLADEEPDHLWKMEWVERVANS